MPSVFSRKNQSEKTASKTTPKITKALSKHIKEHCKIGGPLIYLAGPMEDTLDFGANWRAEYTEVLNQNGFDVINPFLLEHTQKVLSGVLPGESFNFIKEVDLPRYKHVMRTIIKLDLQAVEACDILLCKFNGEKTAGTIHEVGHAYYNLGIPCFLVSELTTRNILGWFLACFEQHAPSLDILMPIIKRRAGFDLL